MKVTETTGMEIWLRQRWEHLCVTIQIHKTQTDIKLWLSFYFTHFSVSPEDFGVETDPVVRHKHFALIQHVSLQGTSVTCGDTQCFTYPRSNHYFLLTHTWKDMWHLLCMSVSSLLTSLNNLWYWVLVFESWKEQRGQSVSSKNHQVCERFCSLHGCAAISSSQTLFLRRWESAEAKAAPLVSAWQIERSASVPR